MNPTNEANENRAPAPDTSAAKPTRLGTHRVSAIYPSREEAEGVRQLLLQRGIAAGDVDILQEPPPPAAPEGEGDGSSDEVLKEVLVDGAIGTAIGTGVGAIGSAALVAANVTLFVASPVVAPLAMLGWFAGLGGIVGAAFGANRKEGKFSELVKDAIESGNTVLVTYTHNESERELAKEVICASLKGRDEAAMKSR